MYALIPDPSKHWILHLLILVTVQEVIMNSALASEISPPLKIQGCLNAPCSVPYFLPLAFPTKLLIMVPPLSVCIFNLNSTC